MEEERNRIFMLMDEYPIFWQNVCSIQYEMGMKYLFNLSVFRHHYMWQLGMGKKMLLRFSWRMEQKWMKKMYELNIISFECVCLCSLSHFHTKNKKNSYIPQCFVCPKLEKNFHTFFLAPKSSKMQRSLEKQSKNQTKTFLSEQQQTHCHHEILFQNIKVNQRRFNQISFPLSTCQCFSKSFLISISFFQNSLSSINILDIILPNILPVIITTKWERMFKKKFKKMGKLEKMCT